jgi:DNA polymerase elongation subunit (family B)
MVTRENVNNILNTNLELDRSKEGLSNNELEFLDSLSDEEILILINECNTKYNYFNAVQNGLKLILNSVYGAFGNKFFVCSTNDIASAITAMCRDVIKLMDRTNEKYWYTKWHTDFELHKILGITKVEEIPQDWVHLATKMDWDGEVDPIEVEEGIYQRKYPVSTYVDTDSLFICFDQAIKRSDYSGNKQKFIENVAKERLEPIFKQVLDKYAAKYKVANIQDFELENINESILFVTKKKYIKHTIWEDGRQYDRLTNIVPKGVTLVQAGTPKFAREKLLYVIKNVFFEDPTKININSITTLVKKYRQEFEIADINDIAQGGRVNNYWSPGKIKEEKKDPKTKEVIGYEVIDAPGVISHFPELKFAKSTHFSRKAAGLYNHLLSINPEYQNNYPLIQDGDMVRSYPTKHELNDRFAFVVNEFPKVQSPKFLESVALILQK